MRPDPTSLDSDLLISIWCKYNGPRMIWILFLWWDPRWLVIFFYFSFRNSEDENAPLVIPQVRNPGVELPLAAPAQPPLTWEEFGRKLELFSEDKSRTASMSKVVTDGALPVESICTLATSCRIERISSRDVHSSGQMMYIPRALDPSSYWAQGFPPRQQYPQAHQ